MGTQDAPLSVHGASSPSHALMLLPWGQTEQKEGEVGAECSCERDTSLTLLTPCPHNPIPQPWGQHDCTGRQEQDRVGDMGCHPQCQRCIPTTPCSHPRDKLGKLVGGSRSALGCAMLTPGVPIAQHAAETQCGSAAPPSQSPQAAAQSSRAALPGTLSVHRAGRG